MTSAGSLAHSGCYMRWGCEETGGDKGRLWQERVGGHIRPVAIFILSPHLKTGSHLSMHELPDVFPMCYGAAVEMALMLLRDKVKCVTHFNSHIL